MKISFWKILSYILLLHDRLFLEVFEVLYSRITPPILQTKIVAWSIHKFNGKLQYTSLVSTQFGW